MSNSMSRFRSIQSLFLVGMALIIFVVSVPLFGAGVSIISSLIQQFGNEILHEELQSLIEPVNQRYATLHRVGLEDSMIHRQEIMDQALSDFKKYRYKKTGTVFVVKNEREIVLPGDFSVTTEFGFDNFIAQLKEGKDSIAYQVNGRKRIGRVQLYKQWQCYIGVSMDQEELYAPRDLFVRINLLVLAAVLFVVAVSGFVIHHYIIKPIVSLTSYAGLVRRGESSGDISGKFVFEIASMKDDFLRMVSSLRSREEKYRAIFSAPSDTIFIHDSSTGEILEVNNAIMGMYGYKPEELIGATLEKLSAGYYPYTLEEAGRLVQQAVEKEEQRFEWLAKKRSGSLFWVEVVLRPIVYGKEQCVMGVVRDIDQQKKAAQELASEKEQLAITLRSITDGVITTDNKGNVLLINKVAESLTDWSQEAAYGRQLQEVMVLVSDSEERGDIINPAIQVLESGYPIEHANNTLLIAGDGKEFQIAYSAAPLFDSDSTMVGVVLVFRDVTEKKRIEQEMLKVQKLESVGILAGGIAHDFNNILAAMLGNINLARIQINDEPDKAIELLETAEKASLRAKNLTQQLLTFAKGGDPVRESADLIEIIKDSAEFVLRGSNVDYQFDVPLDLWTAEIDSGQIGQVVQNIIINSRQALGEEGGTIRITASNCQSCPDQKNIDDDGCIRVSISDDGPGIEGEVLKKIFDPYFSTKESGSGLGLAVCHSIVQKHGGVLNVESIVDQGTTFQLLLPVAEQKSMDFSNENNKQISQDFGEVHVLVMDDEEMIRNMSTKMLQYLGHRVEIADDGHAALALFQKAMEDNDAFDLVIMDLTIPGGMGGAQAVKEVLALDPDVKVIVSSGYSTDPIMANFKDFGFDGRLVKPFVMNDFSETIAAVMSS